MDAARYGVTVPPLGLDDDDAWQGKIELLLEHPVELVSFAFGLPESGVVDALRRAGSAVVATVTSRAEAELAAGRGFDGLVVQHGSAGAHSGAFLAAPDRAAAAGTTAELIREVRAAVGLPLIAAGAVIGPPPPSRRSSPPARMPPRWERPCCGRMKAAPGSCTRTPSAMPRFTERS